MPGLASRTAAYDCRHGYVCDWRLPLLRGVCTLHLRPYTRPGDPTMRCTCGDDQLLTLTRGLLSCTHIRVILHDLSLANVSRTLDRSIDQLIDRRIPFHRGLRALWLCSCCIVSCLSSLERSFPASRTVALSFSEKAALHVNATCGFVFTLIRNQKTCASAHQYKTFPAPDLTWILCACRASTPNPLWFHGPAVKCRAWFGSLPNPSPRH